MAAHPLNPLGMLMVGQARDAVIRQNLMNKPGATVADVDFWFTVRTAYTSHRIGGSTNNLGCRLATHLALHDATKKYRSLPLGRRHMKIDMHIAAYMIENQELKPTNAMQVSHLCHQGGCYLNAHLVCETQQQNLDRYKCQGWAHIMCPGCNLLFNPCQHQPQCVLP
jgi:hypothetical protein